MKKIFLIIMCASILWPPSPVFGEPEPSKPPMIDPPLGSALEHLIQGKDAYYKLSMKEALDHLNEAKKLYTQNLASLTKGEQLFDTHLYLALCHFSRQQLKSASDEIKQAFQLNPKRKPDAKIYPPNFIQFFNASVQSFKIKRTHIDINSTPSFATVYMNGFEMGLTPLILEDWVVGKHYITITAVDHSEWRYVLNASIEKKNRIEAKLAPLSNPSWISKSPISAAPLQQNGEIKKFLKVMNEQSADSSWTKSIWIWPIAVLTIGGITYGVIHSQNKGKIPSEAISSHSRVIANIP